MLDLSDNKVDCQFNLGTMIIIIKYCLNGSTMFGNILY